MTQDNEWSPDEPPGTEVFEQGDEALDECSRIDPEFIEEVQMDPSLDPVLLVDELELEEAGVQFNDPEDIVTLEGGIDDPDGLGGPTLRDSARREDKGGWDLDAAEEFAAETDPASND